eukprot:jgi/Botrbrau1/286/Bobra.0022s0254.1
MGMYQGQHKAGIAACIFVAVALVPKVAGEQATPAVGFMQARKFLRGLKQVFPIIGCGENNFAYYCTFGAGAKIGNLTGSSITIGSLLKPNGDNIGNGVIINNVEKATYINPQNQSVNVGLYVTPIYSEIFNASLGAVGSQIQKATWTREGNGTLVAGEGNTLIGYGAFPADSGTGAPNTGSDYLPGSVGITDVTTTGNSKVTTATSFGASLPGGVYLNHPVVSGGGVTFPP